MSTLHLVAPEARDLVAQFPPIELRTDTLHRFRADVLGLYAAEPLPSEERLVPGPAGAPDVRVLIYRPESLAAPVPAILSIHGGGFVAGTPDMMGAADLRLARETGVVVVAVQYRLAPETSFPGPVEDCAAVLAWLSDAAGTLGIDPDRIAIHGQSAGAGLAAATALLARDRGGPRLAAQLLLYPMLDPRTGAADSPVDNPTLGEFLWTRSANRFGWDSMRGTGEIPADRIGHFAPALARDLSGLPPAFVGVGSLDLFLEEDMAYALRLSRAGVAVEAHVYPGGIHGFDAFPGPLADRYRADLTAAIARMLRPHVR